MNSGEQQHCPICLAIVAPNPRYPRYACASCAAQATDKDGRAVAFGNVALSGGIAGYYRDDGQAYPSQACYIDGVACIADEARFGGIVIETLC